MRTSILLVAMLALAGWRSAPGGRGIAPDDLGHHTLEAAQLERYVAPYIPAIRACYATYAPRTARGELALDLIIARDGTVIGLAVEAPGVTGKRHARLTRCIQRDARTWHFPVRAGETVARLPFVFHRVAIPAGPWPTCFDHHGCRR